MWKVFTARYGLNPYMFCVDLRTNSDLCHLQHKLIGFYNRGGKCLQRVTDWVFKYSGLRLVCRGVNIYFRTNSDLCHLHHNLLVFITEMKSVNSAVRADSLYEYKADMFSS